MTDAYLRGDYHRRVLAKTKSCAPLSVRDKGVAFLFLRSLVVCGGGGEERGGVGESGGGWGGGGGGVVI